MLGGNRKPSRGRCMHSQTVSISSAGIERLVCETCGHVSFLDRTELNSTIGREMFARTVERNRELAATGSL